MNVATGILRYQQGLKFGGYDVQRVKKQALRTIHEITRNLTNKTLVLARPRKVLTSQDFQALSVLFLVFQAKLTELY